jgi:hypothetical protein
LAHDVKISPPEKNVPPKKAIFLYPKQFNKAPLKSPSVIPSAAFKFKISVASRADKFKDWNLSLKISPKDVMMGMIRTC